MNSDVFGVDGKALGIFRTKEVEQEDHLPDVVEAVKRGAERAALAKVITIQLIRSYADRVTQARCLQVTHDPEDNKYAEEDVPALSVATM